ncbi:MAG: hypothetical protein K9W43_13940, partial [Candidatus Thorarchaeota archaeon]|nr:hypothetical protein [Candidatus Thorarchaeota archaeon]
VVLGEIPITKGQRIMWTLIGLIGIIVGGVGGELAYLGSLIDSTSRIIGGAVAAIIGVIMAFFGFRVLLMTQREKRG